MEFDRVSESIGYNSWTTQYFPFIFVQQTD